MREIRLSKSLLAIYHLDSLTALDGGTARGREFPGIPQDAEDGTR